MPESNRKTSHYPANISTSFILVFSLVISTLILTIDTELNLLLQFLIGAAVLTLLVHYFLLPKSKS